jgi:hypothetical protein
MLSAKIILPRKVIANYSTALVATIFRLLLSLQFTLQFIQNIISENVINGTRNEQNVSPDYSERARYATAMFMLRCYQYLGYTASNEFGKDLEGSGSGLLEILSLHLPAKKAKKTMGNLRQERLCPGQCGRSTPSYESRASLYNKCKVIWQTCCSTWQTHCYYRSL